jgi:hypothetical protein
MNVGVVDMSDLSQVEWVFSGWWMGRRYKESRKPKVSQETREQAARRDRRMDEVVDNSQSPDGAGGL